MKVLYHSFKNIVLILFFCISFQKSLKALEKLSVNQLRPSQKSLIEKFDYIEFDIGLPEIVAKEIAKNSIDFKSGLNPFNPKEINVYGIFYFKENSGEIVREINYGFYYKNFERDTSSINPNQWFWNEVDNNHNFRIRKTITKTGNWKAIIVAEFEGFETSVSDTIYFYCVHSNQNSFLTIDDDNKQQFQYNGKPFFPIGQNLPHPTCYINDYEDKSNVDYFNCRNLNCAGIENWCTGLKELPMQMKPYLVYLKELEKLNTSGGNYFRMMIFPFSYEIEFEQLGNYYNRMHCAWELDKLLETCNALDLIIHLTLSYGVEFTRANSKASYGMSLWDWDSNSQSDDNGYCYNKIVKNPEDFLTNPVALEFYQNKIRYFIARWGYSTNIGVLELMNEVKNKFPDEGDAKKIANWHGTISTYIKTVLNHKNHLIGVNYATLPDEKAGDNSYELYFIDVISRNKHRTSVDRKDFIKDSKFLNKFDKPILYAEIGTADDQTNLCDDNITWIKDLWFTNFSGFSGVGLNWNEPHNYELWKNFGRVDTFNEKIQFHNMENAYFDISFNGKVETVFVSKRKKSAAGVITNKTWNFYTFRSQDIEPCNNPDFIDKEKLRKFEDLSSTKKSNSIAVKKLGFRKEYYISFYNLKLNELSETKEKSNVFGKIKLKYPDLNEVNPMVLFSISKEKNQGNNKLKKLKIAESDSANVESIQHNISNFGINVFPNPAKESLNVSSTFSPITLCKLINLQGKIVFISQLNDYSYSIPLNSLPEGFYILNVQMANGEKTNFKILKLN